MEKPLADAIICFTSIAEEARMALMQKCHSMGAKTSLDLRSNVTHLIVGAINTPKYKYAAKNRLDLKLLLPGWIDEMHDAWINGTDIVVKTWEEQHVCPVFYGAKICLTNFHNERDRIEKVLVENGAKHHPDLTMECTHLVAASTGGKKYEFALARQIPVVDEDWISESVQRGACLEETSFDIRTEKQDRLPPCIKSAPKRQAASIVTSKKLRKKNPKEWEEMLADSQIVDLPDNDEWSGDLEIASKPTDAPIILKPKGLFHDISFFIDNTFSQEKREILICVINANHGELESEGKATFKIIPHSTPIFPKKHISEWWLEYALEHQKLPPDDICMGGGAVEGFSGINICITGFEGMELLHIPKLLALLGATFHETLTANRDVLLCKSTTSSAKCAMAKKWGVRIVDRRWLYESARKSSLLSVVEYSLDGDSKDLKPIFRKPLDGCIICLSKSLSEEQRRRGLQLVTELGALFEESSKTSITHYISSARQPHVPKHVPQVSIEWLVYCNLGQSKVDHSPFLLTFPPITTKSPLTKLRSNTTTGSKKARFIGRAASTLSSLSPNLSPPQPEGTMEIASQRVGYVDHDAVDEKHQLLNMLGNEDTIPSLRSQVSPLHEGRTVRHRVRSGI